MSFPSGQYGPEAITSSGPDGTQVKIGIGDTVIAPSGYTATVDSVGNLTVIGPASDSVPLSISRSSGATPSTLTVRVEPLVADLSVTQDLAAAALPAPASPPTGAALVRNRTSWSAIAGSGDLRAFGAAWDGVTDDTNALNLAVAAAVATASGSGRVLLPPGRGVGSLTLAPFLEVTGAAGFGSTLVAPPSSILPAINSPGSGGLYLCNVHDFSIDGNKEHGNTGDAIHWKPYDGSNEYALPLQATDPNLHLHHLIVMYAGRDAVHLEHPQTNIVGGGGGHKVHNIYSEGAARFGFFTSCSDSFHTALDIGATGSHAFEIEGTNNLFTICKGWFAGYALARYGTGYLSGSQPAPTGGATSGDGWHISGVSAGYPTQLIGCQSQDNGRYGLNIDNSRDVLFPGFSSGGDQVAALRLGNARYCKGEVLLSTGDRNFQSGSTATPTVVVIDGNSSLNAVATVVDDVDTAWSQAHYVQFTGGASAQGNAITNALTASTYVSPGTMTGTYTPVPIFGVQQFTLGNGNIAIAAAPPALALPGQELTFAIGYGGTIPRTITWDASYNYVPSVQIFPSQVLTFTFINLSTSETPNWALKSCSNPDIPLGVTLLGSPITGLSLTTTFTDVGLSVPAFLPLGIAARVKAKFTFQSSAAATIVFNIVDATAGAEVDEAIYTVAAAGGFGTVEFSSDTAPGIVGPRTYKVQARTVSGTTTLSVFAGANPFGGGAATMIQASLSVGSR